MPTAPPRNTRGEVLSSTTIFITWQSPEPEELNGIIVFYTLTLLEVPTNTTFIYQQEGHHTEIVITSLHPYYSYECSIAAETIVGRGPFSIPFTIQTREDGRFDERLNIELLIMYCMFISLQFLMELLRTLT